MKFKIIIIKFITYIKDKKNKHSKAEYDNLLYLNSSSILPPPLTQEEEMNCYDGIRKGDEEAKNKLILHNLRLVVYISKKFENSGVAIDDLISIGTIGLIKAVRTFCPDKNIKLATYASRCIENEVLMHLRKISHMKNEISLDEPLNVDWDGNELLLSDILYVDEDSVSLSIENDDIIRVLMECVDKLNERDRKIIYLRFGLNSENEYTQKEVADILGISQSYISRIEKRILDNLRNELKKQNIYG